MTYRTNPLVNEIGAPPIAQVLGWLAKLSEDQQDNILDVSQAVPSYPPATLLTDYLAAVTQASNTSL